VRVLGRERNRSPIAQLDAARKFDGNDLRRNIDRTAAQPNFVRRIVLFHTKVHDTMPLRFVQLAAVVREMKRKRSM
jgi:hypothetical protein